MKKKLLCLLAVLFFLITSYSDAHAKSRVDNSISIAVKKYKGGNYTGCLQDCKKIVEKKPSAIAYYYMAMSYVQAEKSQEAIDAYTQALGLHPTAKLAEYATTGKRCLETPDQCNLEPASQDPLLDSFIASPTTNSLSDSVKKDFEQKRLNGIKNEINNGRELDDYTFNQLNKSSIEGSSEIDQLKVAQNKPTDDEIKAAMKVLNDAGISPYSNASYMQQYPMADSQNAELMQLQALMGTNEQQTNNNNNAMMNMLPYMFSQNKDGTNSYSPQMMQAAILNSMMNNVNYNVDESKY